jgi:hypothetical protein
MFYSTFHYCMSMDKTISPEVRKGEYGDYFISFRDESGNYLTISGNLEQLTKMLIESFNLVMDEANENNEYIDRDELLG